MNNYGDPFDALDVFNRNFEIMTAAEDAGYLLARDRVFEADLLDPDANIIQHVAERRSDDDWRVALVAQALWGWMQTEDLYNLGLAEIRAENEPEDAPLPITGVISGRSRSYNLLELGPEVVPLLHEILLKTHAFRDHEELNAIFWSLAEFKNNNTPPVTVELAQKWNRPELRTFAVHLMGFIPDEKFSAVLLTILGDDQETENLRILAAGASGRMRLEEALGPLSELMLDAWTTIPLREECAFALGGLGLAEAVPALAQTLADGPSCDLAEKILISMERIASPDALPAINDFDEPYLPGYLKRTLEIARYACEENPNKQS